MLQIYDFNFYNVVDHLEIRDEKLFLFYPEQNKCKATIPALSNIKIRNPRRKSMQKKSLSKKSLGPTITDCPLQLPHVDLRSIFSKNPLIKNNTLNS